MLYEVITVLDNIYGFYLMDDSVGSGDKIRPNGNTLVSNVVANNDGGILIDRNNFV